MGIWILAFFVDLVRHGVPGLVSERAPTHWTFWLAVGLGLLVTPYVVNIGFTRNWKGRPRTAVLAAAAGLTMVDLVAYD